MWNKDIVEGNSNAGDDKDNEGDKRFASIFFYFISLTILLSKVKVLHKQYSFQMQGIIYRGRWRDISFAHVSLKPKFIRLSTRDWPKNQAAGNTDLCVAGDLIFCCFCISGKNEAVEHGLLICTHVHCSWDLNKAHLFPVFCQSGAVASLGFSKNINRLFPEDTSLWYHQIIAPCYFCHCFQLLFLWSRFREGKLLPFMFESQDLPFQ